MQQQIIVLDSDQRIQDGLHRHFNPKAGGSPYRFRTLPPSPESVIEIEKEQPQALIVRHEMEGMTGLDLLEMILGGQVASLPALCIGERFSESEKQRAKAMGRVALLPKAVATSAVIADWLNAVLVVSHVALEAISQAELFELLWNQFGRKHVAEVALVLPDVPQTDGWHVLNYRGIEFKVLLKESRVAMLSIV
jgi:CheY-like chemotaxis protein